MEKSCFIKNSSIAVISTNLTNQYYIKPHFLLRDYISHYTFIYADKSTQHSKAPTKKELHLIPDGSGCFIFEFSFDDVKLSCWGSTSKVVTVQNNGRIIF